MNPAEYTSFMVLLMIASIPFWPILAQLATDHDLTVSSVLAYLLQVKPSDELALLDDRDTAFAILTGCAAFWTAIALN